SVRKFGLVGLSKGLRSELPKDGISVTTVCPGLIQPRSARNANLKGNHRAQYAWFIISDALPFTSISAERAARQIIGACKRGQAELIISIQAKAAVALDFLFPQTTTDLLAAVNGLLPKADESHDDQLKGSKSTSSWSA